MSDSLSERFAGASSLADLLKLAHQNQQDQAPALLWKRCALAGEWNKSLYERLAGGIPGAPAAEEFSELPGVTAVGPDWSLANDILGTYLQQWKAGDPELQKTAAILEAYYRETGNEAKRLRFLALADAEQAKRELQELYRQADLGFDLGRCAALLSPLREQYLLLPPSLQMFHNDREQYLQSREIFSDDYYRSTVYLRRAQMEARCEALLAPGGSWMVNLFGLGGLGKTMFVRRLIAYRCVPEFREERTPVARVDLDFVNLDFLAENPWLVLLEAARQLRPQMAGSPFVTLLGPEELNLARVARSKGRPAADHDQALTKLSSVRRREHIEQLFIGGVRQARALLVIDTIEEFLLHKPEALQTLLEVLVAVRRKCPEFRVLLSGRYWILDPQRRKLPLSQEILTELAAGMTAVPTAPFTPAQSREYLRDVRHLDNSGVVEAIVKRTSNPFELSLFADLAKSRPLLTVEAVEACPDAKLAYLIERVIDRMPDEPFAGGDTAEVFRRKRAQLGARWLVRYAVIPQELTLDFVKNVLRGFLEEEMFGHGRRDQTAIPGYEDQQRWRREHEKSIRLDDEAIGQIWDELVKYAASYNWVEGNEDAMQLHAEVVTPMRELLRAKPDEYPIYDALHQAAAEYFESRPRLTGRLLAKALYHRFQKDGSAAKKDWREYRTKARAISAAAVRDLTKSVLYTKDYLDDEREPLRHYRSGLLIDRETLAEMALENAHAALLAWLRTLSLVTVGSAAEAVRSGRSEWKRFGGVEEGVPEGWLLLLDAAEELFAGNGRRVVELLSEPSIASLAPEDQVAARLLLMRVLHGGTENADRQYAAVLEAAPWRLPAFPEHFLTAVHAQYILRRDTVTAFAEFDRAMRLTVAESTDPKEAAMILQWFGDLALANGEYTSLAEWSAKMLSLPARFPFPVREQASDWLVSAYLELRRFDDAANAAEQDVIDAVKTRLRAMVAVRRLQIPDALMLHERAQRLFKDLGYESSALGERLDVVETHLLQGNIGAAKSILGGVTESNEGVHALNAMTLRMRVAGAEQDAGEARRLLAETLAKLPGWSLSPVAEATARASFLASGAGTAEDAAEFLAVLSGLPSPASRFAALRPFLTQVLPAAIPSETFRTAVPEPPESPDWFVHNLAFAAGCYFFGDEARLESALRNGLKRSSDPVCVCALQDLVPLPLAKDFSTPPVYLDSWKGLGEIYRPLALAAHLREAELECSRGNLESSRDGLTYFQQNESALPGPHQWKLRALVLECLLDLAEGRKEDAAARMRDALSTASDMGNSAWVGLLKEMEQAMSTPPARSAPAEPAAFEDEAVLNFLGGALSVEFHPAQGGPSLDGAHTPVANEMAATVSELYPPSLASSLRFQNDFSTLGQELHTILWPRVRSSTGRIRLRVPLSSASATPWELATPPSAGGGIFRAPVRPIEAPAFLPQFPGVPVVMGVQLDFERERFSKRGYGVTGLQLREFYERAGLRFVPVAIEQEAIFSGIAQHHPAVIHISCGLRDMTNPTDVLLDGGEWAYRQGGSGIRPDSLAGAIQSTTRPESRPLIILDVYWDPEDHARQTLLRNRFAAGLIEILAVRAVLAIGDYPSEQVGPSLDLLTRQLATRASIWAVFQALRMETHPLLPPALFTATPDLQVF